MNNNCKIYILSLLTTERKKIVDQNIKLFPSIQVIKSVNGYNTNETISEFKKLGIKFHTLNKYKNGNNFNTYGMLANGITKIKMLKYQVENKLPYICFIEDDLLLKKNFIKFIHKKKKLLKRNINMIRLDTWGEGYITSLESSKRILEHINNKGIIQNIDNQLRINCGREIKVLNTPWKLMIESNKGDCLKQNY